MDRKGIALTLARLSEQDPVFPSSQARETVEILEWVARRGRRADGKERVRRIPAAGCNERATQRAALLPRALQGCVDFGAGLQLLAWPRSLRISALRFAPWPTPKSTATRLTPVFQQSPRIPKARRTRAVSSIGKPTTLVYDPSIRSMISTPWPCAAYAPALSSGSTFAR